MATKQVTDFHTIIDNLDGTNSGAFVTIGHVKDEKILKTKRTMNPEKLSQFSSDLDNYRTDGDDEHYNRLKAYATDENVKKFPYKGVVKFAIYQQKLISNETYAKGYANSKSKQQDIINKHFPNIPGLEIGSRDAYQEKSNYGSGKVHLGTTDNTRSQLYLNFNGAQKKPLAEYYYLVTDDGQLVEINKNSINAIISRPTDYTVKKAVNNGATEEMVQAYKEAMAELRKEFVPNNIKFDHILFISGTSAKDNTSYFFINDNLNLKELPDTNLTPLLGIAKEYVEQHHGVQNESVRRVQNIINEMVHKEVRKILKPSLTHLTEGKLRRMIMEEVDKTKHKKTQMKQINEAKVYRYIKKLVREAIEADNDAINDPEDGDTLYQVGLWPGSGYYLVTYNVYAGSAEHALELVVADLDNEHDYSCLIDPTLYYEELHKYYMSCEKEGCSEEEAEMRFDEQFIYVDATMEGASQPWYVFAENLSIREV